MSCLVKQILLCWTCSRSGQDKQRPLAVSRPGVVACGKERSWVTGDAGHPVAQGGQGGDRVVASAGQHTIGVIEFEGHTGAGRFRVLHIEGRIVGAAKGTLEQHRQVAVQTACTEAIVGGDLGADVRSTHRHDGLIGTHHHASHPTRRQAATVTGSRWDPVAFGGQGSNRIRLGAVQDPVAVIVFEGDAGGVGSVRVLHIKS